MGISAKRIVIKKLLFGVVISFIKSNVAHTDIIQVIIFLLKKKPIKVN